ncbi:MAG: Calx-beta domain-containing protein [Planctomycetaceae bacterium]
MFNQSARQQRRRKNRQRAVVTESLEHRIVLSSISVSGNTVFYNAAPGEANNLTISEFAGTLTFSDTGAVITPGTGPITVVSANEVTVPVAGITTLNVSLGDLNDTLDGSGVGVGSGITLGIFSGGSGNDNLTGTEVTDSFGAFDTQPGNDTIDGLGQLPGQRDTIRITSDQDVTATDTAMAIGTSVSSYANLEFIDVQGGASDNMINLSGITTAGSFTSVQINAGDGHDVILGSQLADSVTISGANPGADDLNLGGQPAGQQDNLRISTDLDVAVTDNALIVGGTLATHLNVERVNIDGGTGANVIDLSGITGASTLVSTQVNAGDGDDTIIGSQIGDVIVVSGNNPGADTIDGRSQGPGQRDVLFVVTDNDITMTNTLLQIGANSGSQINMEALSITGGAGNNVIDLSGIDALSNYESIQVEGGAGNDMITGSQLADRIILSGLNTGSDMIDGQGNSNGDDILFAAADADVVVTNAGYSINAVPGSHSGLERLSLGGGTGANGFDLRSLTAASGISQVSINGEGGGDTIQIADFSVSYLIRGESGFDTLDLRDALTPPAVNITGPGSIDGNNGFVVGSSTFQDIDEIILPPEYDFTAANYSTVEGNVTNTSTVVEVTRSINTSIASSVDVVLTDGTANAGSDFSAGPITVNFAPGEVTKTVAIELLGDTTVEADETILLALSSGIPGTAQPAATFTLLNDDVSNQSPELLTAETDATFADKAEPGDTVTLSATFTDPDAGDMHTAVIDWGDGTTSAGTVDSLSGTISGDHEYITGGLFVVTVTITDGGETDDITTTAVVTGARVTDDGELQVIGTSDDDHISISALAHSGMVKVRIRPDRHHGHGHGHHHGHHRRHGHRHHQNDDQTLLFHEADVASIVVYACDGDDHVHIDEDIFVAVTVFGGAGDDHIVGGSGNDVLIGDRGRDILEGGAGRDILIGGTGCDRLQGDSGQDILIGGFTDHDADLTALDMIAAEWASADSFADRMTNLAAGLLDTSRVRDDDTPDSLSGDRHSDWYFADISGRDRDRLRGLNCLFDVLTVIS